MNTSKYIRIENRRIVVTNKFFAIAMGLGLVLYAVHNRLQPGLEFVFLPHVGFLFVAMSVILIITRKDYKMDFGPKWVWIPMAVIVGSALLRIALAPTMDSVAGAGFAMMMFGVYLVARELGKDIFKVFLPFLIIEAGSVIVMGIYYKGIHVGGIMTSPPMTDVGANYDIAVGFIVFAFVVSRFKYQWLLVPLVLVALFFTGAPEAIFVVGVMGIVLIWRRDWNRKLWLTIGAVILVAGLWVGLGYGKDLYSYTTDKLQQAWVGDIDDALTGRIYVIQEAMSDIQPLGHGYEPGVAEPDTVHNVPLIIVDQLGIPAAIAFLIATGYCLVRTRWKYAWFAVLSLCVFDHFIWTQIAPFWWALAGVSTVAVIDNDYIYKQPLVNIG